MNLKGKGFEVRVKEGDLVKKGDLLMRVDLNYIRQHAPSPGLRRSCVPNSMKAAGCACFAVARSKPEKIYCRFRLEIN